MSEQHGGSTTPSDTVMSKQQGSSVMNGEENEEGEPDTPRQGEGKRVSLEDAAAAMKEKLLEMLPKLHTDKKNPIKAEEYLTEKHIAACFWNPRKEEFGGKPWLDDALYIFAHSRAFDYASACKRFFKFNAAAYETNIQSLDEMAPDIAQTLKDSAAYHMADDLDAHGRPVVYCICSFWNWDEFTVMAMKRMHIWIFWQWATMWGEVAQIKGVNFVMIMKGMTMAQYKKEFEDWANPIFVGHLPVKFSAMYMCYDPFWFGNMIWPMMKYMMSKKMRERVIWLGGKDEKVISRYLESAFNVTRGNSNAEDVKNIRMAIPIEMCGEYVINKETSDAYFSNKWKVTDEEVPLDCVRPVSKKKK